MDPGRVVRAGWKKVDQEASGRRAPTRRRPCRLGLGHGCVRSLFAGETISMKAIKRWPLTWRIARERRRPKAAGCMVCSSPHMRRRFGHSDATRVREATTGDPETRGSRAA